MKLQIKSQALLFDIFDNMVTQILINGYSEYPFKLINGYSEYPFKLISIKNSLRIYNR
jgi:hypothetical protein